MSLLMTLGDATKNSTQLCSIGININKVNLKMWPNLKDGFEMCLLLETFVKYDHFWM